MFAVATDVDPSLRDLVDLSALGTWMDAQGKGYEAPADGVPSEHVPTRQAMAREKFAGLLA